MQKRFFFFLKFKQLHCGLGIWMVHHQEVHGIIWEEIKNKNETLTKLSLSALSPKTNFNPPPASRMSGRWNIFILCRDKHLWLLLFQTKVAQGRTSDRLWKLKTPQEKKKFSRMSITDTKTPKNPLSFPVQMVSTKCTVAMKGTKTMGTPNMRRCDQV